MERLGRLVVVGPCGRVDQSTAMSGCRLGQSVDVVATFQDRDQTPLGMLPGDRDHGVGQRGKVLIGQSELSERVVEP